MEPAYENLESMDEDVIDNEDVTKAPFVPSDSTEETGDNTETSGNTSGSPLMKNGEAHVGTEEYKN